jgi:NTE family protein
MQFGVNWVFERDRIGDYRVGYDTPPTDFSLATAVAASSCFPPVFNPLHLKLDPVRFTGGDFPQGDRRNALVRDIRLTDGGDYDNLGLEPVWKDHAIVIVSDGGAPFDVSEDRGLFRRLERYSAILSNQAHALRVRWLLASYNEGAFGGAYWGLRTSPTNYGSGYPGYSKTLATDLIAKIRTDLDAFSDPEAAVLQNHGYWLVDAALQEHVSSLVGANAPPAVAPYPEWMDERRVRTELKDSHRRRVPFGRSAPKQGPVKG